MAGLSALSGLSGAPAIFGGGGAAAEGQGEREYQLGFQVLINETVERQYQAGFGLLINEVA